MTFQSSIRFHNYPSAPRPAVQPYLPDGDKSLAVFTDHGPRLTIAFKAVWPNGRANIPGCDQTRAEIMVPAILNSLGGGRYAFQGARNPRTEVFRDGVLGTEPGSLTAEQAQGLVSFVEREMSPCRQIGLSLEKDGEIKVDATSLRAIIEAEVTRFVDPRTKKSLTHSEKPAGGFEKLDVMREHPVAFPTVSPRTQMALVSR